MIMYINARDVLPKALIIEIQKYVEGSLIYIPQDEEKSSGCASDYKNSITERNNEIKNKKKNGKTIDSLMEEYHLSYDTIKSIVYRKK